MKSIAFLLILSVVMLSSQPCMASLGNIVGGVGGVLDGIKGIVSNLQITLNPILTSLDTLVTDFINNASGLSKETVTDLKGQLAALNTAAQNVSANADKLVGAIAKNASSDVILNLTNILKESVNAVKVIVAKFPPLLQQTTSNVSGRVTKIKAALNDLVAAMDAVVRTVNDNLSAAVGAIVGQLIDTQGQALLTLNNKTVAGVKANLTSVAGITEELLSFFELLDKISPAAENVLDTLKVAVSNLTPDTIAAVTQALGRFKTAIEEIDSALKANPAFAAVIPTVEGLLSNAVKVVNTILMTFVNEVKGLDLSAAINAALDNLLSLAISIRIN